MEKKVIFGLSALFILITLMLLYVILSGERGQFDSQGCLAECISQGYVNGSCSLPIEAKDEDIIIRGCVIPFSKICGISGSCNCYCEKGEDFDECEIDSDCVIYGKTGDCGTGCYAKDKVPSTPPTEKCFSLAPESCICNKGACEGVN